MQQGLVAIGRHNGVGSTAAMCGMLIIGANAETN